MKAIPPGRYVIYQPYLTGGCQVVLRCQLCWHQFDRELTRQPNPTKGDTLVGKCPQCNREGRYAPQS
jgi:hypothetical protein